MAFSETWVSERRVRRVSFSWRVDRTALLFSKDLNRRSVEFHGRDDPDVIWTLYLFSSANSAHSSQLELPRKVSVSVRYISKYDPFLYMRPFLCPKDQEKVEATKDSDSYKFLLEKEKTYSIGRGIRVVIDSRDIDPTLDYHDINVTLIYMGRLLKPRRISLPIRTLGQAPVGIAADLEKLLSPDSDIPADTIIHVEGMDLKAHRAILSARSPVFQAMFRSDMLETKTGEVSLHDITADVFSALLQYMYTGRVHPVTCSIADLLSAADRFDIADLKNACEAELVAGLDVDTAYDALCLHERYNCPKLRSQALSVLRVRIIDAIRTPWWDDMTKNDPQILADIIESNRSM